MCMYVAMLCRQIRRQVKKRRSITASDSWSRSPCYAECSGGILRRQQ